MSTITDPHLERLADHIRPRTASNVLLWAILGFFGLFILWASLTKLDRTIHAPGRVVPSGRLQVLSIPEPGIIQAIMVKPGDPVKRGQVLVRLDPVQYGAELGSNQSTLASLTAKTARLEAEIRGGEPHYPTPRNDAEAEQLRIEQSLHAARLADLSSQLAAAEARATQASRAVTEAQAAYRSRVSARDSARQQLELIRPLVDRGIEPRLSLIQLENTASVAASDAAQAAAGVARAQGSVAEARAAISAARQDWRAKAGDELAVAQADMAARSTTTAALADRVRRSNVVSPVDGRVNRLMVSTVGSSITPGQPIVEVVPSNDALVVDALVTPRDIARVRVGQKARLNVSAYESAIYGSMDGRVITVSPDATIDEKTGESHYTVRVQADTSTLRDQGGNKLPITPGMMADVNLLGEKRSVMSYILTPITRLQDSALRE